MMVSIPFFLSFHTCNTIWHILEPSVAFFFTLYLPSSRQKKYQFEMALSVWNNNTVVSCINIEWTHLCASDDLSLVLVMSAVIIGFITRRTTYKNKKLPCLRRRSLWPRYNVLQYNQIPDLKLSYTLFIFNLLVKRWTLDADMTRFNGVARSCPNGSNIIWLSFCANTKHGLCPPRAGRHSCCSLNLCY